MRNSAFLEDLINFLIEIRLSEEELHSNFLKTKILLQVGLLAGTEEGKELPWMSHKFSVAMGKSMLTVQNFP